METRSRRVDRRRSSRDRQARSASVYACELIVQVLAGLGAAHARGIVHRASETGQRHGHVSAPGFAAREGSRFRVSPPADPSHETTTRSSRGTRVPGAGADSRTTRRRSHRSLLGRRDALRDARGRAAVLGQPGRRAPADRDRQMETARAREPRRTPAPDDHRGDGDVDRAGRAIAVRARFCACSSRLTCRGLPRIRFPEDNPPPKPSCRKPRPAARPPFT